MDLLTKLGLTKELDTLANLVLTSTLPIMARIEKVRRIDEIVKQLTDTAAPAKKDTLLDVVLKKHGLAVRLKPKYEFEQSVRQYTQAIQDEIEDKKDFIHTLNLKPEMLAGEFLREKLARVLSEGVFIEKHNGGLYLDYVRKADSPIWGFMSWLYDHDHFITGPKAIAHQIDAGDMFGAGDDDQSTADEDFEAEAKSDLVDPPVDEAGVFYQSVIDGAEVDVDLIQKAIEYAQQDQEHYLLADASQAIKNAVLNKALLV